MTEFSARDVLETDRDIDAIERRMSALKTVLHQSAVECRAAIDAIPLDADVGDEMEVIEAAMNTVDHLAKLVLRTSAPAKIGGEVKALAQAWLDGEYWKAIDAAA